MSAMWNAIYLSHSIFIQLAWSAKESLCSVHEIAIVLLYSRHFNTSGLWTHYIIFQPTFVKILQGRADIWREAAEGKEGCLTPAIYPFQLYPLPAHPSQPYLRV